LFEARWYLWPAQYAWWIGFVAVISGWIVTETGRQPWVAYGLLRTAEAVSPLAANTVATTLVLFVLVYGVVFTMGLYYINRLIALGPDDPAGERRGGGGLPVPSSTANTSPKVLVEAEQRASSSREHVM
jgi:cytochrome d ubiquinol oxidase subunit I